MKICSYDIDFPELPLLPEPRFEAGQKIDYFHKQLHYWKTDVVILNVIKQENDWVYEVDDGRRSWVQERFVRAAVRNDKF